MRQSDGATVHVKAVNWFGFNNHQTMLEGLYSSGSAAASDMAAITWQLRLLGFNGVRLPFIFDDVLRRPVRNDGALLSWCSPTTARELARRAVDPEAEGTEGTTDDAQLIAAARAGPTPLPAVPLPPAGGDATRCNSYLPTTSTLDRFLWVVQWFAANGFFVLLDYHPMGLEWTSHDVSHFVGNWTEVWRAVTCLPNYEVGLSGRVFLDLLNEPDSIGQRWERAKVYGGPSGGGSDDHQEAAGLTELYLAAMDALWAMTPRGAGSNGNSSSSSSSGPIFFLEGGGQTAMPGVNWGNGFATDRAVIAERGLSDPNPFFEALMRKPYRRSVVIAPHVYGPSVSGAVAAGASKDAYSGPRYVKALDTSFGYLSKQGFCLPAVERATGRVLLDAEDEAAVVGLGGGGGAGGGGAGATAATAAAAGDRNGSSDAAAPSSSSPSDADHPLIERDCQRFPVAIGEFGSRFESPEDLEHLNSFAAYLNNEGVGRTEEHNAVGSWAYWAYNANSWDTGGLVDDSWQNLLWTKLRFLRRRLGMRGWYEQEEGGEERPREGGSRGGGDGGSGGGGTEEERKRRAEAERVDREWWAAGETQPPEGGPAGPKTSVVRR